MLELEGYELLDRLGEGSFGEVFLAVQKATEDTPERKVAVKIIDLEEQDDDMEEIQHEISVLANCQCTQLTKYFGSYVVGSSLWIIMEYMEGGSLGELMPVAKGGVLDENTIAWAMKELCTALVYLHGERKIHRDIKAGNVLVSVEGDVKLADFGATGQLTDTVTKRQTFVGTPFWMAPEVIAQTSYDSKADIWSVGITAVELAKGEPPYGKVHPMKVLFLIPKNPPPVLEGEFSQMFKDFVSLCLQKDPASRPTAAELLQTPFLRQACGKDALKRLVELRLKQQAYQRRSRPSALDLNELASSSCSTLDSSGQCALSLEALPTPPRRARPTREFEEEACEATTPDARRAPPRAREGWDFTVASMDDLERLRERAEGEGLTPLPQAAEATAQSPRLASGNSTPILGSRRARRHRPSSSLSVPPTDALDLELAATVAGLNEVEEGAGGGLGLGLGLEGPGAEALCEPAPPDVVHQHPPSSPPAEKSLLCGCQELALLMGGSVDRVAGKVKELIGGREGRSHGVGR